MYVEDTVESRASAKRHAIHFKFNQGFSNAVRRAVHIDEFL
jgi:hypothetical protein